MRAIAFASLLFPGAAVRADAPATGPTTIPAAAARLVKILAPGALWLGESDRDGIVIVAQQGVEAYHLSVYGLDGDGEIVAGEPQRIRLPWPESLKQFRHCALCVAFHPKLPLAYIWHDIDSAQANRPESFSAYAELNHVLVFSIDGGKLTQKGAFCPGDKCINGTAYASLALDGPKGERLFVPHLRNPANGSGGIGYFDLDEKGMPRAAESGVADAAGVEVKPVFIDAPTTGMGFIAINKNLLMFARTYGLELWDIENRRGALGSVTLPGNETGNVFIAGDPAFPRVLAVTQGQGWVYSMDQVDGYPTGLPQRLGFNAIPFESAPAIMLGKANRMAVGAVNAVHILGLDGEGRITQLLESITLSSSLTRAVGYSRKHDRLYVAVEKNP
ncbi:MAG TPA: hypothetical protein VIL86_01040 [Tepidisphaeraceae bacterium]|jgi:hypothetical protein